MVVESVEGSAEGFEEVPPFLHSTFVKGKALTIRKCYLNFRIIWVIDTLHP